MSVLKKIPQKSVDAKEIEFAFRAFTASDGSAMDSQMLRVLSTDDGTDMMGNQSFVVSTKEEGRVGVEVRWGEAM